MLARVPVQRVCSKSSCFRNILMAYCSNGLEDRPPSYDARSQAIIDKPKVVFRYQDNMAYGVYAATTGYVKDSSFEAARLGIMRSGKTKDIYRIPAELGITKKGEGSRMGKGKGKVAYYAAYVKAGQMLMEFNCENDIIARLAFKQATFKLPLKTHFRIRPTKDKQMVNCTEFMELCKQSEIGL